MKFIKNNIYIIFAIFIVNIHIIDILIMYLSLKIGLNLLLKLFILKKDDNNLKIIGFNEFKSP